MSLKKLLNQIKRPCLMQVRPCSGQVIGNCSGTNNVGKGTSTEGDGSLRSTLPCARPCSSPGSLLYKRQENRPLQFFIESCNEYNNLRRPPNSSKKN
jgi:hypothetical protein